MRDTDYIMRMVEQFARFLARIIVRKKNEQNQQAEDLIGEALANLLGLDLTLVDSLPLRDVLDQLSTGDGLDADKCVVLAVLLDESAGICQGRGEFDLADRRRLAALDLLLEAHNSGRPTSIGPQFERIDQLRERLNDRVLPESTTVGLMAYYEAHGRFGWAEDVLFDRLDSGDWAPLLLDSGIALYHRLLDRDEERLARGNLPRNEVEEGLAELERIRDSAG